MSIELIPSSSSPQSLKSCADAAAAKRKMLSMPVDVRDLPRIDSMRGTHPSGGGGYAMGRGTQLENHQILSV